MGALRGELQERYHARRRHRRALLEAQQEQMQEQARMQEQHAKEQGLLLDQGASNSKSTYVGHNLSRNARRMLMVGDAVMYSPNLQYGLEIFRVS